MGRRTVVIVTDDLTGEEVPDTEAEDVALKFGYDEWVLVLTAASKAKVREQLMELVQNGVHKDGRPKWMREQEAGQSDSGSGATSVPDQAAPTVTIVPPDNKMVRRWWRDLTANQLKSLSLKAPPATDRGKIPEDVMSAFVAAHAAPAPTFSG